MGNLFGSDEHEQEEVRTETDSEFRGMDCDQRFLEEILRIYKLDLDNEELYDIFKAVKKRLVKSVKHLKGTKLEVSDIVLCGSMAERTRIWDYAETQLDMGMPVIQFNFLAILEKPAREWAHVLKCLCGDRSKVAKTIDYCDGHKSLVSNLKLEHEDGCECEEEIIEKRNRNFLCRTCLRSRFHEEVIERIVIDSESSSLKFQRNSEMLHENSDTKYAFLWPAFGGLTAPSIYNALDERSLKIVSVHVDFMPVFLYQTFDQNKSCQSGEAEMDNTNGPYYLIPRADCGHQTCFRVSYCRSEIRALRGASQTHRDVYMALKVLTRSDPVNKMVTAVSTIPSYILKTAVLHHLTECGNDVNIADCLRDVLWFLIQCYRRRKLMSADGEINLLSRYSDPEYKADMQEHKEHLKSLMMFLDTAKDLDKSEYDTAELLLEIGINP